MWEERFESFFRDNRVMPQAHVWKHTGACSPSVKNCVTSLNHFTSCFIILSTLASYVSDLRGSRPRRFNSICLPEHYCQLEDTMYSYESDKKLLAAFVDSWVNSWNFDCQNSRANIHFSWYLTSDPKKRSHSFAFWISQTTLHTVEAD